MASSKNPTMPAVFFLLFLLASQVVVPGVEGRICRVKSRRFWRPCFSDRHCAEACVREGFGAGSCEGFRRRCMCQKPC